MTGTKVKICGLFRTEDIGFANVLRPDYIGFVLQRRVNDTSRRKKRRS